MIREYLGYLGMEVAVSSLVLAVLLFSHTGLLFAQIIVRRPSRAAMTIFLAIFVLHPFNTELFYFANGTFDIALAIWLA